jgi:hypothetical protein
MSLPITGYNQILPIIERLPPREKLRLAVYLIRQAENHLDVPSSNIQAVLDFAGTWEGDDLDDLLDLVYATRSPVTWRQENDLPA